MISSVGCLFQTNITGTIGTNSSSKQWRENLEGEFSQVPPFLLGGKKLAIQVEFWISKDRLTGNRLDCDNLAKPVLDSMKKAGIIYDDSEIYYLQVSKHATSDEEHIELLAWEWAC